MFRFGDPYHFFLFLPLALAAWWVYRRRVRAGILFAPSSRLPATTATWRTAVSRLLPAVLLAGIALAILALARPQTILSRTRRSADVIAIEMVVDVSGSMEALDLSVRTATGVDELTRLDAVKRTFREFVKRRPDDLVGLVTFGGYASTRCPLTTDHHALLHVLEGVQIPKPSHDKDGQVVNQEELLTAIGDALATACARIRQAEPKSKVVVLLSDGESNTGVIQPDQAVGAAKELGIKVYTIGVGSTGRAPFRARDMFGRDTIQYAMVSLDEKLLRQAAEATGGKYFNVRSPDALEKALADIDTLEKTRVEQNVYNQYHEWFGWFLAPAAGLIVAGAGLNMMIARRIV
jgi:Ca-activated chloride channel family protein